MTVSLCRNLCLADADSRTTEQPYQRVPPSQMAEGASVASPAAPEAVVKSSFISRWLSLLRDGGALEPPSKSQPAEHAHDGDGGGSGDTPQNRRGQRRVVPGLPRAKTWKRQQSEEREKLQEVAEDPNEKKRAVSVDRRIHGSRSTISMAHSYGRASAPDFLDETSAIPPFAPSLSANALAESMSEKIGSLFPHQHTNGVAEPPPHPPAADGDDQSLSTEEYESMIANELKRKWILNLSMQFRDRSRREKFFITYREDDDDNLKPWRRVTISLDYREAPEGSLEMDLAQTEYQREKSQKIYEAIRESLPEIKFYDTVTNLKLQTTNGRLHVHVVEDTNEVINFPPVRAVEHLGIPLLREQELSFHSHMSGFVYRVTIKAADGQERNLIKKEIPGPDTVDEFLYEINALGNLRDSADVIQLYGVVVDPTGSYITGLLIDYAPGGSLVDYIYDHVYDDEVLSWRKRREWALQIVRGLNDIHEAGYVQGDFTLSNIVIDSQGRAKIIDINRRGCPVGWEPPEASALVRIGQRITMYIGVKSDLYQLGMVLWAIAMKDDEPERQRPLSTHYPSDVPQWFRNMIQICLSENPRDRLSADKILEMFPQDGLRQHLVARLPGYYDGSGLGSTSNGHYVLGNNGASYVDAHSLQEGDEDATESHDSYSFRGRSPGPRPRAYTSDYAYHGPGPQFVNHYPEQGAFGHHSLRESSTSSSRSDQRTSDPTTGDFNEDEDPWPAPSEHEPRIDFGTPDRELDLGAAQFQSLRAEQSFYQAPDLQPDNGDDLATSAPTGGDGKNSAAAASESPDNADSNSKEETPRATPHPALENIEPLGAQAIGDSAEIFPTALESQLGAVEMTGPAPFPGLQVEEVNQPQSTTPAGEIEVGMDSPAEIPTAAPPSERIDSDLPQKGEESFRAAEAVDTGLLGANPQTTKPKPEVQEQAASAEVVTAPSPDPITSTSEQKQGEPDTTNQQILEPSGTGSRKTAPSGDICAIPFPTVPPLEPVPQRDEPQPSGEIERSNATA